MASAATPCAVATPAQVTAPPADEPAPAPGTRAGLANYVFVQVALLAAVSFVAGASPLLFGNDTTGAPAIALSRLAPGLVVALVATVATATMMNRRLARGTQAAAGREAGR